MVRKVTAVQHITCKKQLEGGNGQISDNICNKPLSVFKQYTNDNAGNHIIINFTCDDGHLSSIYPTDAKDNKKLHDEIIGCGFVHDVSTATARISEVKEDKFLRVLNIDS